MKTPVLNSVYIFKLEVQGADSYNVGLLHHAGDAHAQFEALAATKTPVRMVVHEPPFDHPDHFMYVIGVPDQQTGATNLVAFSSSIWLHPYYWVQCEDEESCVVCRIQDLTFEVFIAKGMGTANMQVLDQFISGELQNDIDMLLEGGQNAKA